MDGLGTTPRRAGMSSHALAWGHGGSLFVLLLALLPAEAGPLEPKRSREPLSAVSVERSLAMPRGWYELAVLHTSGGGRHRQDVDLRFGLAPRTEVVGGVAVHESAGAWGLGDAHFGVRIEAVATEVPTTSLVGELGLIGASGPDLPSGPDGPQFSAGGPGMRAGAGLRQQLGALAVDLHVTTTRWVAGVRPASWQHCARAGGTLQGGPVVLRGATVLVERGGLDLRADLGVELHVSRGFELGFVMDLLIDGDGTARLPSQGAGASRVGSVTRVHF